MARKRLLILVLGGLVFMAPAMAQHAAPALSPQPATQANPEFLRAADEVLAEMSKLLSLPVKAPLKKSIRTREEIRDYVIRQLHEDKDSAKRYADQKALEKFGLIPKGFDLDAFLVELLTEQIAGLYDPKAKEFYIADWINLGEQRMVMAHELTHALHDQYFNVDSWLRAAKPNDDATLARDAVLEGSALAAMIDYLLREQKVSVRDLPDLEELIHHQLLGDFDKSSQLARAPAYVRDSLLFPYFAGTTFTQRILRVNSGWSDFHKVFEHPPASTQQVLHPDLYLAETVWPPVALPDFRPLLPPDWKKLDENVVGEFGLHAVLKQFLGEERAARLSPAWAGERYAIFEHEKMKQVLLVHRLRLKSQEETARFFGNYSEALELKYPTRSELFRRPNFFHFSTPDGGVFLRCLGDQCLSVEGADPRTFDRIASAIGWPAAPERPTRAPQKVAVTMAMTAR